MDLDALIKKEADKQVKALAAMESRLDKRSVALQKELYATIRDKFLDSLAKDENGKLIYNVSNLNRVNNMTQTWEYFRDSQFRPEVLEFGKDLLSIVDVEAGYFMALGNEFNIPFEFDKVRELIAKQIGITLDRNPSIVQGSYLDRLLQGSQVQDKVTNIVLENVSSKASFSKLKRDLSDVVLGDSETNGAMTKYLRTYAYDTFSIVQRTIDLNMADTYGMNCFVYEGNLIKDSREFCQEHLGEIICRDQFAEFEAMDWQGKNPDVPFEVSLGGYNCRHNPMWIPDEAKQVLEGGNKDVLTSEYKDGGELFEANLGDKYKYSPLPWDNWNTALKTRLDGNGIKLVGKIPNEMTKLDADQLLEGLERGALKYKAEVKEVKFFKSKTEGGRYFPETKRLEINNLKLGRSKIFEYERAVINRSYDESFNISSWASGENYGLIGTTTHEGTHATYWTYDLHSQWIDALKRNFVDDLTIIKEKTWEGASKYKFSVGKSTSDLDIKIHETSFRYIAHNLRKAMNSKGFNVSDYWSSSAWEAFAETGAQIELGYITDPRLIKAYKETLAAIKY